VNDDAVNSKTRRLITLALALAVGGTLMLGGVLLGKILRLRVMTSRTVTTSGVATIGGPFTLVATNGQNVGDQTYRGKWVLIYFGYTFCPDACPTTLNSISVALEKLGSDAGNVQPLFVTVDPNRDTRDVMIEYLKPFDQRILGLTGTKDQIDSVIKEYHLYVSQDKSDGDGDNYLVSHSSYIYLMNPQGKFVDVIPGGSAGDEIAVWLRKEIVGGSG
jgi:protein SCO1/2